MSPSPRLSLALPAFLLALAIPAQVEPGWGAFSHFVHPQIPGSTGGIQLFHPWTGAVVPVTGTLPVALTTNGGAGCVLVRDSDGSLVVSHHDMAGTQTVSIYHITLNGSAVATVTRHPVGASTTTFGSIDQMAWLPGGRVLFSHRNISGFVTQGIAILDLSTGVVTSVPFSRYPGGTINAVAASRDGQTAYCGYFGFGATSCTIWSVPLPGGGTPTQVGTTLPSCVYQFDTDDRGNVYIGTCGIGLWVVPAGSGTPVQVNNVMEINAMSIDRVTGEMSLLQLQPGAFVLYRDDLKGSLLTVGNMPQQAISGIAIRSSLIPFGAHGNPSSHYDWQIAPALGGPPQPGNLGFSLTATTAGVATQGVLALAAAPLAAPQSPFPVANMWLDPATILLPFAMPVSQTATVPLPIPPGTPSSVDVYAQAFHLQQNGALPVIGGLPLRVHLY